MSLKNLRIFIVVVIFSLFGVSANAGDAIVRTTDEQAQSCLLAVDLSEMQKNWIKSHPVIKLGVLKIAPPYEYVNKKGEIKGISSSYIKILAENTNLKFELVTFDSWHKMYEALKNGEVDALPFVVGNDLFDIGMVFSKPYVSSSLGIFSSNKSLWVNDLKDIRGANIAIVQNMLAHISIGKSKEYDWSVYDDVVLALGGTNRGIHNYFVGDIFNTKFLIEKLNFRNIEFIAPVTSTTYKFGFGAMEKNKEFISIVNAVLKKITPAHKEEIKQRWTNSDYTDNRVFDIMRWRILLSIFGALVLIIGIVLSRNYKLKRQAFRLKEKAALSLQMQQNQKLESIGRLAGGVAHDFNNMLAGISGAAECIELNTDSKNPLRKYSDIIINACDRAAHLTSQLLLFARDKEKDFNNTNMHECIQESLYLLEHGISKKINIKQDFQATNYCVSGNRDMLQNMILNLGFNAKDAMPNGGTISVETKNKHLKKSDMSKLVFRVPEGDYLEVVIKDTGCGIGKEIIHKIFEPFFTTKEVGKGTGLGLSAVYGIVSEHRGSIRVKSKDGKGTAFHMYFPIVENEIKVKCSRGKIGALKAKVLIVDDEKILLELLSDILKSVGSKVVAVNNSVEAVEVYKQNPDIELVMLDVIMPGKGGQEIYEELRKINPKIKVVFMSGYTKNAQINTYVENNDRIEFVNKPYMVADVVEKLAILLAKK